jgi:predicted PhzF superfamily epimerase YddE/YHI9
MLNIAKEHSGFVSEVVYVTRDDAGGILLTYYSSECEVAFCGHGTIAAMYEVIRRNDRLRKTPVIEIGTNRKGRLNIYNHINERGLHLHLRPRSPHDRVPPAETVHCAASA